MSGFFDWLFGSEVPRESGQDRRNRDYADRQRSFEAAGYCSAWIDSSGKVRDKKCGDSLDQAQCRERQLLRAGKVAYADNEQTWDHNISVEKRYVKGRGKHSTKGDRKAPPQKRYADRLRLLRQVAADSQHGDPCTRKR